VKTADNVNHVAATLQLAHVAGGGFRLDDASTSRNAAGRDHRLRRSGAWGHGWCLQRHSAVWLVACLLLLSSPSALNGQTCLAADPGSDDCLNWEIETRPRWQTHTIALGINAALGGFTAGIARKSSGETFWDSFWRGALGGSVHYSGKVISARDFAGAGLLGRQTASLGSSMVRNASVGRGFVDQVVVPVGPVRIYIDRKSGTPVRTKLDLVTGIGTAYAAVHSRSGLDLNASLSSGALVFTLPEEFAGWSQQAAAFGGVIMYRENPQRTDAGLDWLLSHEIVHVAQHDFLTTIWSQPAESWLMGNVLGGPFATASRYIDLGLYRAITAPLTYYLIPTAHNPWEQEALFLGARPPRQ
jgi:hypothetical protein